VAAYTSATPISAAPARTGAKRVLTDNPPKAPCAVAVAVAVTVSANVLICRAFPSVPMTWTQYVPGSIEPEVSIFSTDVKLGIPVEGDIVMLVPDIGGVTESETIPIEFPTELTCTWAVVSAPWTTVPDEGEMVRKKLLDAEFEIEEGVAGQEFDDVLEAVEVEVVLDEVVLDVVVLDVEVVDELVLDAELELCVVVVDELDDVVVVVAWACETVMVTGPVPDR
jgi:hypothetical protein